MQEKIGPNGHTIAGRQLRRAAFCKDGSINTPKVAKVLGLEKAVPEGASPSSGYVAHSTSFANAHGERC